MEGAEDAAGWSRGRGQDEEGTGTVEGTEEMGSKGGGEVGADGLH